MINKENVANDYFDLMYNANPNKFEKDYPTQDAEDAAFDRMAEDLESYRVGKYLKEVSAMEMPKETEDFDLLQSIQKDLNDIVREAEFEKQIEDLAMCAFGETGKEILDLMGDDGKTVKEEIVDTLVAYDPPVYISTVKKLFGKTILKYVQDAE